MVAVPGQPFLSLHHRCCKYRMTELRTNVADLLRWRASRRPEEAQVELPDLAGPSTRLAFRGKVAIDLVLEHVPEGIVARGAISARWEGSCSRCLEPVAGDLSVALDELFEARPVEGQTYMLDGDEVDLEAPIRDALLLELPSTPLCRQECLGLCPLCGVDRNRGECICPSASPEPRWATLGELDFVREA